MGQAPGHLHAPRVIVLIGLMGSGKSSIGRRLAHSLGVTFYDTDEMVATATKKSVRELFAEGETTFRSHERDALLDALNRASQGSGVVATGGGVVTITENCKDIRDRATDVVWLDADIDELVARTANGAHRPLLDGGARGKLEEMQTDRKLAYQSLATLTVPTKGRSIAAVTEYVVAHLGEDAS